MRKSGFTLAEVLISMAIIGVLAVLIMPKLVINTQNRAVMANLSSIVNNLETAFTKSIEQETPRYIGVGEGKFEQRDDLTGTDFGEHISDDHAAAIGNLKQHYSKISGFQNDSAADFYSNHGTALYYMNNDGSKNTEDAYADDDDEWTIELTGGPVIFVKPVNVNLDEATAFNRGTVIRNVIAELIIDANGISAPNIVGRDVFKFYLASDGKLYPHGSREYSRFLVGDESDAWTGDVVGFSCQNGHLASTWGCTARVVDEGYEINY